MADSNITKRALASSLKKLMETKPFAKISISDVCEACDMNRKSFYYHFKDKYDLVNWIFYAEFMPSVRDKAYEAGWGLMDDLCAYFYENRSFYRKTLTLEGQNSFSEYFRDIIATIIAADMEDIFGRNKVLPFYVDFYTDALLCAIKRWLLDKDCMPSEEFVGLLKNCLLRTSDSILQKLAAEPDTE